MGSITLPSQGAPPEESREIGNAGVPAKRAGSRNRPLLGVFAALLLFMVIYFARPEDWIPGLSTAPLAKLSGALVILALIFSLRHIRGRLPWEIFLLALLVGQLFLSSALSPVWRGGAFQVTLDFSKVLIIVLVMSVAAGTLARLKTLILTQALCLVAIAAVAIWKGHMILGRLEGVLGANYADPNDLALAIVISIPLGLLMLFLSKNWLVRLFWTIALGMMTYAVLLTGSRGGFLALAGAVAVCLWEFAIRGRRPYLLALALLAGFVLWQSAGGMVAARLKGTLNVDDDKAAAYESAQARQRLFWRSIEITEEHPIFGVGPGNFNQVSGQWHTTHNSLTLISSEGGIPAFLLFVSILVCGFMNLRTTKRLTSPGSESRLLAGALFASLAGYVIGALFLSTAYLFFPYILVGYTIALVSIARKSAARGRQSESSRFNEIEWQLRLTAPESDISFLAPEIAFRRDPADS